MQFSKVRRRTLMICGKPSTRSFGRIFCMATIAGESEGHHLRITLTFDWSNIT
jgi:hypothetical protein